VATLAASAGAGILTLALDGGVLTALTAVLLALLGTLLGLVDVACRRLPTAIVVPSTVVGAAALVAVSAGTGDWGSFGTAVLGALTLGAIYLALYALPGGNLGFGDVQLAVLLGLLLGYLGWPQVIWGALLPWLVNAPIVLALLASGRVGRRSRVPFGPSLLAGAVLSVGLVAALQG
jgi:leader peptidase (prepilin peptidase)/N-methyltransferase